MERGADSTPAEELLGRLKAAGRLGKTGSAALFCLDGQASCAMLVDGEIYRGKSRAARLELLPLDCALGERGTIARLCGDDALKLALIEALPGLPRESPLLISAGGKIENAAASLVYDAAALGDPGALELLSAYARTIALALMSLIHLYDPERILLAGRAAQTGALLTGPIEQFLREKCFFDAFAAIEWIGGEE